MLKTITVFCGSASTCPEKYNAMADHVGRVIASQGRRLVYGSGSRGLMGLVAKGAQAEGGYVIGVNAKRFVGSKYQMDIDEYIVAETMQERKVNLIDLGDASISLPGGVGTFDELTEIFSLAQLGIADKPFGILNMDHFFDGFLAQMQRCYEDNFLKEKDYKRMIVAEDIETLLQKLDDYHKAQEEAKND